MQIYHFDRETRTFRGSGFAHLDPKSGLPVLPAHSTFAPPPDTADDQVAVWDTATGVWSVVEDHRGKTVYSGWESAGVVDYLGPIRDGYSLSQGDKPQSVINAELIKDIKLELAGLDMEAIRPLHTVTAGQGTQDDLDKLADLEASKQALRAELAALESGE